MTAITIKNTFAGREVKKALLNIHGGDTEASTERFKKSRRRPFN